MPSARISASRAPGRLHPSNAESTGASPLGELMNMNLVEKCISILILAAMPGFTAGPEQTVMQLRVASQCAVIDVQHVSGQTLHGVRSGVTRFRLLLRTSAEGSASLISDFRPAGAVNASVTYVVSIAQADSQARRVAADSGSRTELVSFPPNSRSSREGLAGEVAWSYAIDTNLLEAPSGEPSLTISCR